MKIGDTINLMGNSRLPFRQEVEVLGEDLGTATFVGEVRLNGNQDSAVTALASFSFSPVTVTTEDYTEGRSVVNGPVSRFVFSLDEGTMGGLPKSGDPDVSAELAYDIHMTFNTLVELFARGKFIIVPGVTNA